MVKANPENRKMLKQIISFCAVLASCWVSFSSCNNSGTDLKLQAPAVSQAAIGNSGKTGSGGTSAEAKERATDDLLAACMAETESYAKYAAYSKKAGQEGYRQIALLFKAVSEAENILAGNHKAALDDSGARLAAGNREFSVKTTKENLLNAIKGETYKSTAMYPEFINAADAAGEQMATLSLNYALKTGATHRLLYENALAALGKNMEKSLSSAYYICATCGNTYDAAPPQRCGVCMTRSEKFMKIL